MKNPGFCFYACHVLVKRKKMFSLTSFWKRIPMLRQLNQLLKMIHWHSILRRLMLQRLLQ